MQDISGFGASVSLRASFTFPSGLDLTQFADDADPFDIPSQQIADKAMGLNGHLVSWSKANPVTVTLNIIPDSDDDRNLAVLADANRVRKGKNAVGDIITLTAVYPDGKTKTFAQGKLTDAAPSTGVSSAGRRKSKAYTFAFESVEG
jgi:hypothetical protein